MVSGSESAGERADRAGIVPRWEWRTFGEKLEHADAVLAAASPAREQDSDELYLLSVAGNASVKVRDGRIDVKHLLRVNDDGLELWVPVLQAAFPLSNQDVAFVSSTLNVEGPSLPATSYPLEVFEREVVRPNLALLAARVHKRRRRSVVDDCMVEMTDMTTDHSTTDTLAFESSDPSVVLAAIRRFGLEGRSNVSVPRGLKMLLGFGRYAVIDVGTNSVKFHIGERQADGRERAVVDRAEVSRLGEGQGDSGLLAEEPIRRTIEAITMMADEAGRNEAVAIAAVGTAGLRRAPNRAVLVDAVRARCGVTVEIISGEEEARLAHIAATSALPSVSGPVVVFDSGGGSTQFTFGHDEHVDERFSVEVGAARMAERFGLAAVTSRTTLDDALVGISAELERLDARPTPSAIIAIGGTATNLAAVKHGLVSYDPDAVHGTVLELDEIDRQIELYRTRDPDERRQIAGLQPARAEVILAGACIVRTILTKLQHESATVSDRGLRHGVFIERFGP